MLSLPEEFFLFTITDEGRSQSPGTSAAFYGLRAAILLDLAHQGRISLSREIVRVLDTAPTGSRVLDTALTFLSAATCPNLKQVFGTLGSHYGALRDGVIVSLAQQGVLTVQEDRILRIFRHLRYPTVDAAPEWEARSRIHASLLGGALADEETTALIALLFATDLLHSVFPRQERRPAYETAKTIAQNAPEPVALVARWVREAVDAEATAIAVAAAAGA